MAEDRPWLKKQDLLQEVRLQIGPDHLEMWSDDELCGSFLTEAQGGPKIQASLSPQAQGKVCELWTDENNRDS